MDVSNIEYVAPNRVNGIGSIGFTASFPVAYSEGTPDVPESEGTEVALSEETIAAIRVAGNLIIRDIVTKP